MPFSAAIKTGIRNFFPGYFAIVMATGIISLAANSLAFDSIANLFFWINNFFYAIAIIVFLARLLFFFPQIKADLSSHAKGAGFLTMVAASSILGSQYALTFQKFSVAAVLFILSVLLWIIFTFTFVCIAITEAEKPELEKSINGNWLLITVSAESLSVLAAIISSHVAISESAMLFISLCFYLLGFLFYVVLITLIFFRLFFLRVRPQEFEPPYWIDMGAAAIISMAGMTLAEHLPEAFKDFIPFVNTSALLSWAISTWWIPVVITLELWHHRYVPWRYQPAYWSLVFPLGMYTASTGKIAEVLQFSFLKPIPQVFIFIALLAWAITLLAMVINFWKTLSGDNG
jgi:tellurite resistance protein TehA-like permease